MVKPLPNCECGKEGKHKLKHSYLQTKEERFVFCTDCFIVKCSDLAKHYAEHKARFAAMGKEV